MKKSDCIFVSSSNDTRVAEYAAHLFLQSWSPYIIFSGGNGRGTESWVRPEADVFADIAIQCGVPNEKILIENKSTNTGENILFTKKVLTEKGLDPQSIILVQKPYMMRRAFATFKKLWSEKEFIVTSPDISFDDYPNSEISKDTLINFMVGDLQRIKIYPEKGFQIHQDIPVDVWHAYEKLLAYGYTEHCIKE